MAERDRMVAVTGATGRQGGAVVRHLLDQGWRVRALTRRPQKDAALRLVALGAEVVAADMEDRPSLDVAFRGAHGVFSVQNPMISGLEREIAQGKNVADAARSAGVSHFVYGSAGVGYPTGVGSWDSKLAVKAHAEALGLPLTVLRPMAFMELMTDKGFSPSMSTWSVMPRLMGSDRPVYWLSVDDLGRIVARVLAQPERFLGADLELVADVQSNDQARAIWRDVVGRPPRSVPIPVTLFERFVGTDLTTMWRWLHDHLLHVDLEPTRALLPAALTVRAWLERQTRAPRPT